MNPSAVRVGIEVLVPWGAESRRGRIVEVWDSEPIYVRVYFPRDEDDEFSESTVILADSTNLLPVPRQPKKTSASA